MGADTSRAAVFTGATETQHVSTVHAKGRVILLFSSAPAWTAYGVDAILRHDDLAELVRGLFKMGVDENTWLNAPPPGWVDKAKRALAARVTMGAIRQVDEGPAGKPPAEDPWPHLVKTAETIGRELRMLSAVIADNTGELTDYQRRGITNRLNSMESWVNWLLGDLRKDMEEQGDDEPF